MCVISPLLGSGYLKRCLQEGEIEWRERGYQKGDLEGALLAFATTNDPTVQAEVVREARERGVFVNVADTPAACDFQVPASFKRGDLTISVSTEGKSPAVAAFTKKELEELVGPEYEVLLRLTATLREQVLQNNVSCGRRKDLFQKLLHPNILQWIKNGEKERIFEHIQVVFGPETTVDSEELRLE